MSNQRNTEKNDVNHNDSSVSMSKNKTVVQLIDYFNKKSGSKVAENNEKNIKNKDCENIELKITEEAKTNEDDIITIKDENIEKVETITPTTYSRNDNKTIKYCKRFRNYNTKEMIIINTYCYFKIKNKLGGSFTLNVITSFLNVFNYRKITSKLCLNDIKDTCFDLLDYLKSNNDDMDVNEEYDNKATIYIYTQISKNKKILYRLYTKNQLLEGFLMYLRLQLDGIFDKKSLKCFFHSLKSYTIDKYLFDYFLFSISNTKRRILREILDLTMLVYENEKNQISLEISFRKLFYPIFGDEIIISNYSLAFMEKIFSNFYENVFYDTVPKKILEKALKFDEKVFIQENNYYKKKIGPFSK